MKFSVFQLSRIGGRKKNEDRAGYTYTQGAAIFLVADGLGGHPAGEVASQLGLQVVMSMFHEQAKPTLHDVPAFMRDAMMAAHQNLVAYAMGHSMVDTPSTTMVIAIIQDHQVYVGHCGDSRMYLVRDEDVFMQTTDHSMLMRGSASGEGACVSRHTLYNCLGASDAPFVDVSDPAPLHFRDRLLLCSDGLWGSVAEADIVEWMSKQNVADASAGLMELALQRGGAHGDNATLISVAWEEPDNAGLI